MGILEDVIRQLERIPAWKRVLETPDHVARLEQRIAQLEAQLGPVAGDQCPKCKGRTLMLKSSAPDPTFGDMGVLRDQMGCSNCGHSEQRQRNTMS